ncbi:MAG: hypothetical protein MJZ99_06955 [Bacteroidales bacterium]|nr:hypothetical protein [Bacteroidales bacterium]
MEKIRYNNASPEQKCQAAHDVTMLFLQRNLATDAPLTDYAALYVQTYESLIRKFNESDFCVPYHPL